MKNILLPIDRSEASQQSFSYAKTIAENLNSKLVIVSVVEIYTAETRYAAGYAEKFLPDKDFMEKETNDVLEKAKSFFDGSGIEVETKILWGSPGETIIEYAEDENFDLVIMNTQGMSASKRFIMGSVANKVVKHATVPVMIVR